MSEPTRRRSRIEGRSSTRREPTARAKAAPMRRVLGGARGAMRMDVPPPSRGKSGEDPAETEIRPPLAAHADGATDERGPEEGLDEHPDAELRLEPRVHEPAPRRTVLDPSAEEDAAAEEVGQAMNAVEVAGGQERIVLAAPLADGVALQPEREAEAELLGGDGIRVIGGATGAEEEDPAAPSVRGPEVGGRELRLHEPLARHARVGDRRLGCRRDPAVAPDESQAGGGGEVVRLRVVDAAEAELRLGAAHRRQARVADARLERGPAEARARAHLVRVGRRESEVALEHRLAAVVLGHDGVVEREAAP